MRARRLWGGLKGPRVLVGEFRVCSECHHQSVLNRGDLLCVSQGLLGSYVESVNETSQRRGG